MPRYAVRFRRALCRAGCLVFTCLLILPSMAGCRKKTPEGKAFRFLLDSDPRQLDPQVSTDRSSVTMAAALFEPMRFCRVQPCWNLKTYRPKKSKRR